MNIVTWMDAPFVKGLIQSRKWRNKAKKLMKRNCTNLSGVLSASLVVSSWKFVILVHSLAPNAHSVLMISSQL